MLTVACVLRTGGDFDVSWVEALERACFERIREPHKFICLTDFQEARVSASATWIDWKPLWNYWPGWWSKIELFRPGLFEKGEPVLYFDLDTIIVRDVGHLFGTIDCDLVLLRDFYRLQTGWGTGIMGWTAGDLADIYSTFRNRAPEFISKFRSDQDYIRWHITGSKAEFPAIGVRFWQDEFPTHFVSYKIHCQERGVFPPTAHVICFHGRPRPNEIFGDWVQQFWGTL